MKSVARHHRPVAKTEKRSWTEEETEAVLKGVERWGKGKWSSIKDDPDFGPILVHRTTIDIKDKYRNLMTKKQNQVVRATSETERSPAAYPKPVEFEPKRATEAATKPLPHTASAAVAEAKHKATTTESGERKKVKVEDDDSVTGTVPSQDLNRMDVGSKPMTNKKDSMTLTVQGDKRTLVLNLKGTTKASKLLSFVLREFQLEEGYALISGGTGAVLDLSKPLKDQIPVFDLLRVVKEDEK